MCTIVHRGPTESNGVSVLIVTCEPARVRPVDSYSGLKTLQSLDGSAG
jgi:hypothetical protein